MRANRIVLTIRAKVLLFTWFVVAMIAAPVTQANIKYQVAYVTGNPAPGVPGAPDAVFTGFGQPATNELGGLAFGARYSYVDPDGGQMKEGRGIWGPDGQGGLRLVAVEGMAAPGTNGDRFDVFNQFGFGARQPLNDAGDVLVRAFLAGPDIGPSDYIEGLWLSHADGTLDPLALAGEEAPDTGGGTWRWFHDSNPLPIAEDGSVAFYGSVEDRIGLWRSDPNGNIHLVAMEGQAVPGATGFVFSSYLGQTSDYLDPPRLSFDAEGGLTFEGWIDHESGPPWPGGWVGESGRWRELEFDNIDELSSSTDAGSKSRFLLQPYPINTSTSVDPPPGSPFENGWYLTIGLGDWLVGDLQEFAAYDRQAQRWKPAFAVGDLLEVAPGDVRALSLLYTGAAFDVPTADGNLQLLVRFMDDSWGIVVFTIPEPTSLSLLGLLGLALIRPPNAGIRAQSPTAPFSEKRIASCRHLGAR